MGTLTKERILEMLKHYEDRSKVSIEEMLSISNTEPIALMNLALAGLENQKRLDWMLLHGARVYNYQEYTGRRDGCGYYCSYHPHKGPSDTPLEALDLAIKYEEQNRTKE